MPGADTGFMSVHESGAKPSHTEPAAERGATIGVERY